jgi:uncharacterized membrane protein YciS (DUF1049 family)
LACCWVAGCGGAGVGVGVADAALVGVVHGCGFIGSWLCSVHLWVLVDMVRLRGIIRRAKTGDGED